MKTIIIADDHKLVAEGLQSLLSDDYSVVDIVHDGLSLIRSASKNKSDVIISDISMPSLSGLDALQRLREQKIRSKVILITMSRNFELLKQALTLGVDGYLLKDSVAKELKMAIQAVLKGKVYITPEITAGKANIIGLPPKGSLEGLSLRQQEILKLLMHGKTVREIAESLSISRRTVEFHKYEMMRRLGLKNTTELLIFGAKNIDIDLF